jgi:hypothetical protein
VLLQQKDKMRTFLIFLLAFNCSGLLAQQVMGSAGSTFSNVSGSISFTIGEGIAQTLTKGGKTLTQGFHQATISVSILSEISNSDFSISVFPNPASDEVTIKMNQEKVSGLQYMLFDINGRILIEKHLHAAETKIPVNNFSEGIYVIKVLDGKKELKVFKIIKK